MGNLHVYVVLVHFWGRVKILKFDILGVFRKNDQK